MKYLRTLLMSMQTQFMSWANLLGWFLNSLIPCFAFILVWFAILGNQDQIGGYTKGDFIIYYFFLTIGWYVIGGNFHHILGGNIKDGLMNVTLLKPYNIVYDAFLKEQSWKIVSLLFVVPISVVLFYVFRDLIQVKLTVSESLMLITSMLFGAIIFALIEAIMGLMAFWFTEIWPLVGVRDFALAIFGARLIPFTLMPYPMQILSNFLPFKYIFYTPLSILTDKTSTPLIDVGIQLIFVAILFLIYKFVWSSGIRRYEAVGG